MYLPVFLKGITSTSCNFEGISICSFTQEATIDDFDWSIRQGATNTSLTGPSTGQGGSGFYAYIEASNPRVTKPEKTAIDPLENP